MTRQQKKARPSESLTTVEPTQRLQPVDVNRMEASGQHSTPSAKTGNSRTSTTNLNVMLSNLTETERENALLAAGIFASTLTTLLKAGMVRKVRNKVTGEVLLAFPSTVWTDDLKLK